jgi:hypothetical protein
MVGLQSEERKIEQWIAKLILHEVLWTGSGEAAKKLPWNESRSRLVVVVVVGECDALQLQLACVGLCWRKKEKKRKKK